MPVENFNSVFVSGLSKLFFWVISEKFQLSFSQFDKHDKQEPDEGETCASGSF